MEIRERIVNDMLLGLGAGGDRKEGGGKEGLYTEG